MMILLLVGMCYFTVDLQVLFVTSDADLFPIVDDMILLGNIILAMALPPFLIDFIKDKAYAPYIEQHEQIE